MLFHHTINFKVLVIIDLKNDYEMAPLSDDKILNVLDFEPNKA